MAKTQGSDKEQKVSRKRLLFQWLLLVVCFVVIVVLTNLAFDRASSNNDDTTPPERSEQKSDDYVGLSEQAALDKAKQEGKRARIVEREGKSLPVTMDLMQGRLNFSVKDGKVYKVDVEGEK